MSLKFAAIQNEASLKAEMNRNYALLDDLDSPREAYHPNTRLIRPIGDVSLRDSVRINYKKRALSYTHGALLATRYTLIDFEEAKIPIKAVVKLYNKLENQTELSYTTIENFAQALKNLLEPYGISSKDIRSGEMVANLERDRVKKLKTQLGSENSAVQIIEKPERARMDTPAIQKQYQFIEAVKSNGNFNPQTAHALEIYRSKNKIEKGFINILAGIGWALESCGCSSKGYFSGVIAQFNLVRNKNLAKEALHTANAPKWYQKQNRVVQGYLLEHANDKNLPAIPATLRGIPGLPNMSVHEARFSGQFPIKHSVIRHGTLTPYEMNQWDERESAALANGEALAHIIKQEADKNHARFWSAAAKSSKNFKHRKVPVADLSFMSPTHGEAAIGWLKKYIWGRGKGHSIFLERYSTFKKLEESNRAMKLENKAAYLHGIAIVDQEKTLESSSTNLGINGDRWLMSTSFRSDKYQDQVNLTIKRFNDIKTDVKALLGADKEPFNNQESENKYLLACNAAEDLEVMAKKFNKSYLGHMFSSEVDTTELINAELFASCLYALVIQGMGGTVSACCKSSKDRTGLFLLHIDAMHQYFAQTGELIHYAADEHTPERKRFVDIMSNLYLSNTQQYMASQTTYGAFGLKEPNGLLGSLGLGAIPIDLEKAIISKSPRLLNEQKYLAKANKVAF